LILFLLNFTIISNLPQRPFDNKSAHNHTHEYQQKNHAGKACF
jgi:hypothetical protein